MSHKFPKVVSFRASAALYQRIAHAADASTYPPGTFVRRLVIAALKAETENADRA